MPALGPDTGSVHRALQILEVVAKHGSAVTGNDIARIAAIPRATAYRLINQLVADGYLVRLPDFSGLALGARTRELAGAVPTGPTAAELVAGLRSATRFAVHLVEFTGAPSARVIDADPDHRRPRFPVVPNRIHASALGKLILARYPILAVDLPLPAITGTTITTPVDLAVELARIRERRFAWEDGELRRDQGALALAIGGAGQALVVVGPRSRLVEDEETLNLAREATQEWERAVAPNPAQVSECS